MPDLDWADPENIHRRRPHYPGKGWQWHNCQDLIIEGRLWGGCLEVLELHLCVRKYLPDFEKLKDAVLFIETSEEMPSEGFVYRFIASLAELRVLTHFKAILMGCPKAQFCNRQLPEGREAFIVNQQNAIQKALQDYDAKIPVVFNMNFGHTDPQMVIPNGGSVKINCPAKTVAFL